MIYTHLAAAVIAALAAWFFQDNRYAAEIVEMRLERAEAVLKATTKEQAKQAAINDKYQGALNAAITRENALRRDVAAAARESDRLRAQLDGVPARVARATDSAVREYASAASVVFAQCVRSYQELAGQADGHAADVRLMQEAWPK